jgi:hypothetical protein
MDEILEMQGEPGSIANEAGDIWTNAGYKCCRGKIFLNRDQVAAAEVFGWRVAVDQRTSPRTSTHFGMYDPLVAVER